MRLYKLISRHGQRKQRLWPWFKPPAAGAPVRYDGWVWSPELREWTKTQVLKIVIPYTVPEYPKPPAPPRPAQERIVPGWHWQWRYNQWAEIPLTPQELSEGIERGPEPTRPPGPADPHEVLGWKWYPDEKEWAAIIYAERFVEFEPPRSFPPTLELAVVHQVFPATEQYAMFYKNLIDMGLDPHEARRIGKIMVDGFWNMSRSAAQKIRAEEYAKTFQAVHVVQSDLFEKIGVYGVLIVLATITGLVMGEILERVTFRDEDDYMLPERKGTYLLGPDNWAYSRQIGTSVKGRTFYSHCQDIGTEYVRHKRQRGKFGYDIIDFPGGFVETGYEFPYYVKYRWSHWVLEYVGMLSSCGPDFYMLKKADTDRFAEIPRGRMKPVKEWCKDFDYYL